MTALFRVIKLPSRLRLAGGFEMLRMIRLKLAVWLLGEKPVSNFLEAIGETLPINHWLDLEEADGTTFEICHTYKRVAGE